MFETKRKYNETEMRTLIELLYGSIAVQEQALSSKIFLWVSITWEELRLALFIPQRGNSLVTTARDATMQEKEPEKYA